MSHQVQLEKIKDPLGNFVYTSSSHLQAISVAVLIF